jgi:hypothetical protein
MSVEELVALFEKHDGEYGEFDRVVDPPSQRPDLCAFLLLDKLVPNSGDIVSAAAYDEFSLGVDLEVLAKVATEDDIIYLRRCGVFCDAREDCLYMLT